MRFLSVTLAAALSEEVKHRRTFGRRLVVFGPALMGVLYAFLQVTLGTREASWPLLIGVIFAWWATVWTPLGSALAAALSNRLDGRIGSWRALRARPIPPTTLYVGKLVVLAFQTLVGAVVLVVAVAGVGLVLGAGTVPVGRLLGVALLPWVAALPLLAIGLWVSTAAGLWASVALGMVGLAAGALTAETANWFYVPWAWPVRAAIPAAGVHASGIPLEPSSVLANPGLVPPVLVLSLAAAAAVALLGALWFSRGEVR